MKTKKEESDLSNLLDCIEVESTMKCEFCGTVKSAPGLPVDAVNDFCEAGWEYVTSKKYQMEAAACPDCAKKPDKQR